MQNNNKTIYFCACVLNMFNWAKKKKKSSFTAERERDVCMKCNACELNFMSIKNLLLLKIRK